MPEKVLFSHDPSGESIGYQLLGRSSCENPASEQLVDRFVGDLKLRAADIDGSIGWAWTRVDDRYCFARVGVIHTERKSRCLEYRMVFFSAREARDFDYNPFPFAAALEDNQEWLVHAGKRLTEFRTVDGRAQGGLSGGPIQVPHLPVLIPWIPGFNGLPNLLSQLFTQIPTERRSALEVRAPLVVSNQPLRIRVGMRERDDAAPTSMPKKTGDWKSSSVLSASLFSLLTLALWFGIYSNGRVKQLRGEVADLQSKAVVRDEAERDVRTKFTKLQTEHNDLQVYVRDATENLERKFKDIVSSGKLTAEGLRERLVRIGLRIDKLKEGAQEILQRAQVLQMDKSDKGYDSSAVDKLIQDFDDLFKF